MRFKLTLFYILIASISTAQLNHVDSQGRKQGEWAKPYDGVKVYQYKGQFKNDRPVGKFTYFYKSSKVKAVIKHSESNRSEAYLYHENGSLMSYGIFRNQKKDSVWLNFGPSQRLSNTETFKKGVLQGQKVVFYVPADPMDKSRRAAAVYNYEDGLLDGEMKELFENQTIKVKGQYQKNKKIGKWYSYNPNGKKMMLNRYNDRGQRHGYCNAYDNDGKLANRVFYYYGNVLEGEKLIAKLEQLKELKIDTKVLGIDPNK